MKKLYFLSVLTLSAALLTSGCHRKPRSLTPIPDDMSHPSNAQNNNNIGNGTPVTAETPTTTSTPEGIPIGNSKWDALLANGKQDREKFKTDTVYFEFDRATIKSSEESKLQDVANYFKGNSTDALIIEGNCDERGTEKYNLSLGERRALAAREFLANLGIDPQRIKTVTYGASKPAVDGHSEAAWSKNRRDDMVLVSP